MSEPTSPDSAALGPVERLHPLFLLTGLGGSLRGVAGGYAALGYLVVTGRLGAALIAGAALLLFMAISVFLYWRRFSYRVDDSEIRIDSGIISRTHRSIPYDRIHDVDITQGPLARLFNIAKVKFETGSAAAGGSEEGVLQAIALERAEDIRRLVRARRGGAQPMVEIGEEQETDAEPVFALPVPRLLLAGLFNFSLAVFAGLFGLTQTAGDLIGFDPLDRSFWRDMLSANSPVAAYVLEHRVVTAVAGLIVLVLVGALTGVVRTVLRDFGFRLDRTGAGLRRRRGLLTRTDVTVPLQRAQAATLASGPVRAAFGWLELRLQSLASDEGGKGDHVLAPLADQAEADAVLDALGWRPVPASADWQPVSFAYVKSLALGASPLLIAAAVQAAFIPLLGVATAAAYGLVVAVRWLGWRRTRWVVDGDRILLRSGWWRLRLVILPLAKIQSIDLTENLFSRLFGSASLLFGVAGGSGFAAQRLPALPRETARALRWRLLG